MTQPFDPQDEELRGRGSDPWFGDLADDPHDGGRGGRFASFEEDPRVQAGIEHLQRAAHEVIAASRALLDVAEDLVDSPGGVTKMFDALGDLGELAQRVARSQVRGERPGDDPDADPPVQRIPVS